MNINVNDVKKAVSIIAEEFAIKKVVLFGSLANGLYTSKSDVDLIIEFSVPITLITLGLSKERLEDILKKSVDIIQGPLIDTDMLEIDKEIEVYAA